MSDKELPQITVYSKRITSDSNIEESITVHAETIEDAHRYLKSIKE